MDNIRKILTNFSVNELRSISKQLHINITRQTGGYYIKKELIGNLSRNQHAGANGYVGVCPHNNKPPM